MPGAMDAVASHSRCGERCASSGTPKSSQKVRDSRRFETVEVRKSPPNEKESPFSSSAPRGALSYPRRSREGLEGRFLGPMALPGSER